MIEGVNPRLVDGLSQFFKAVFFGCRGFIDKLSDADLFEIVAAFSLGRRVAAGRVVKAFFALADGAKPEVFRQIAVAAALAVEHQIFEADLARVE